jgi:hypothetical protein
MSTPTRFVAFGDNHGDMADENAVEALCEFIKDYKPTVRVHLGDCFDFRSLRRGVGSDAEGAESLLSDIQGGEEFLERTKPTVYLMGNHEHRAVAMQHTSGSALVRDYCADLEARIKTTAKSCGVKTILPYHAEKGVYRLGPVAFIHGYAHGLNATAEQGKHYADRGGALIHGHTHTLAQVNLTKAEGGAAFSAGCLCQKDAMAYASHRLATSRWGSGFAAGWVDGKDWKVWLVHRVGSRWVWTTDLKVFTPKSK